MMALAILFLGAFAGMVSAQGKIWGKAVDGDGEVLPLVRITLKSEGSLIAQTQSNADGEYQFANLPPATYDVEVALNGKTYTTNGIVLSLTESRPLELVAGVIELEGGKIVDHVGPPIFTVDPIMPNTKTREVIVECGIRNPFDIAAIDGGYQSAPGRPIQFRGGRENTTGIFIDGVKQVGVTGMPVAMYGQITTFSGGLPAEYGDVSGGVMVISSRNPGMKGWFGPPRNKKAKSNRDRSELPTDDDHSYTFNTLETQAVF